MSDNIVFVLGAGASKTAGAPLMKDFLLRADDLAPYVYGAEREAFDLVRRGRVELQAVHSKADYDIRNLESVFNAFEMASRFGQLGRLRPEDVAALPDAMRWTIVRTIEKTMVYRADRTAGFLAHDDYRDFAVLVRDLRVKGHFNVTVVTFNYDIGADVGLARAKMNVEYGTSDDFVKADDGSLVRLLKLHGSLNWRFCDTCRDEAHVWPITAVLDAHDIEVSDALAGSDKIGHIEVSKRLASGRLHCGHDASRLPFIVPPTWNKSNDRVAAIANVWRHAAQALRHADSIIIIGYSWPRSDQFFQSLYALGTAGDTLLKRFWIFNPDALVKRRFRALVRGQAADPDCFQFFEPEKMTPVHGYKPEVVFSTAIREIRTQLLSGR